MDATEQDGIRVMLADDHQMFRDALRSMLERVPRLEIVAETGDGLEVLRLARQTSPDIVCMDIGMPGLNGIDATRRLLKERPAVKVIALSAFSDQQYVLDMLKAGACGYVTKAEAGEELLRAIGAARRNRQYLCPDVASALTSGLIGGGGKSASGQLGDRETQVLRLVAEGNTSAQIAELLRIAVGTVDVHRRNISRKLELNSIADLTRYAIRHGIASA
jgi:two-component system NarL family response regulator